MGIRDWYLVYSYTLRTHLSECGARTLPIFPTIAHSLRLFPHSKGGVLHCRCSYLVLFLFHLDVRGWLWIVPVPFVNGLHRHILWQPPHASSSSNDDYDVAPAKREVVTSSTHGE